MHEHKYEYAFIIRTPYHYINAQEALSKYNIEKSNSILVVWSNIFEKKFSHLIEKKEWGNVYYLPVIYYEKESSIIGKIKNRARDLWYLARSKSLSWKTGKIKVCFAVLPNSKWITHIINSLGSKRVVIIDEGIAQFDIIKEYLSKSTKRGKNKNYGFDRSIAVPYEIFTSLPINEEVKKVRKKRVKKHSFGSLKSKYNVSKFKQNCGLLIGAPHKGDRKKYYEEFVHKSVEKIKSKVKKVCYKPHRNEEKKETVKTVKKYDLQLINKNLPIEIYLLKNKLVPKYISGFTSTAIHSLYKIYGKRIKKVMVFIKKSENNDVDKKHKYYKNLDKKVISLRCVN